MISDRQKNIFDFIVGYKSRNDGNSPTIREIADGCGISSTSVVSYNLLKLAGEGVIALSGGGVARRIEVIGGSWTIAGPC